MVALRPIIHAEDKHIIDATKESGKLRYGSDWSTESECERVATQAFVILFYTQKSSGARPPVG
jgi:hypothetical protein